MGGGASTASKGQFDKIPVFSVGEALATLERIEGKRIQVVGRAVHAGRLLQQPISEKTCLASEVVCKYGRTGFNDAHGIHAIKREERHDYVGKNKVSELFRVEVGTDFLLTDGKQEVAVSMPEAKQVHLCLGEACTYHVQPSLGCSSRLYRRR